MSLDLHVDTARWRAHIRTVRTQAPGLVPVAKGNGYGFGISALADEAAGLDVPMLAVGTIGELATAASSSFAGQLLVLEPWRPFDPPVPTELAGRVVRTVSRVDDVAACAAGSPAVGAPTDSQPIIVELFSTMHRHGVLRARLPALARALAAGGSRLRLEGFALHLPLPGYGDADAEIATTLAALTGTGLTRSGLTRSGLPAGGLAREALFVSHVPPADVARLAAAHPGIRIRPRIGTALWLGDPTVLRVTSTVLDVHPIARGDRFGYRQRRAPMAGHLVVCSGGTANGIATQPPSHVGSLRHRAVALAAGGLEAAGLALSPFTVSDRRRWFAEPPHMQVSMLFLPAGAGVPAVGDELAVNAGLTLTRTDRVLWE